MATASASRFRRRSKIFAIATTRTIPATTRPMTTPAWVAALPSDGVGTGIAGGTVVPWARARRARARVDASADTSIARVGRGPLTGCIRLPPSTPAHRAIDDTAASLPRGEAEVVPGRESPEGATQIPRERAVPNTGNRRTHRHLGKTLAKVTGPA